MLTTCAVGILGEQKVPDGCTFLGLLRVLILSLILLFSPVSWSLGPDGKWVFGVDAARADSNDDDDEDDDDVDDEDDDDDDDEDDDEDDDDDDDDDEDENDHEDEDEGDDEDDDDDEQDENDDDDVEDEDQDDGGRSGNDQAQESHNSQGVPENLHLRYANGWDERILNGRYILIDPEGRTVTNRRATMGDQTRMRDAAGL